MTKLPPSPFMIETSDFPRGFDVEAFMNDIEQLPAFLVSPNPKYLKACEIETVLKVLAGQA